MTRQQRQQEMKAQYDAYIAELRRLIAKKYGEQLSFNFEEAPNESQFPVQ